MAAQATAETVPDRPAAGRVAVLRRLAPPPALGAFVVLLALMYALAYAAGSLAGPVAPGMHPSPPGGELTRTGNGNGSTSGHSH